MVIYGITPNNALTFAVVPSVLGALGFVSTYFPLRRVAFVQQTDALRREQRQLHHGAGT